MKKMGLISFLVCLVIVLSAMYLPIAVLMDDVAAADNVTADNITGTTTPEEITEPEPVSADYVTISTDYPRIDALASGTFEYNLNITYQGDTERVFDLKVTSPSGWDVYIEPTYETGKKISSITIDSSYSSTTKSVKLTAKAPSYPLPDPNDYKLLVEATSGSLTGSLELIARISAKYAVYVIPVNQLYNTNVQAGKNNIYSIQVSNTGTALLDGITFTSSHPDGWEIEFTPDKIETLKASDMITIDVNIKPPPKTVAGDYMISLQISGKQVTSESMDIRVSVKTPTI